MIITARYIAPVVGAAIEGGALEISGGRIVQVHDTWQGRAGKDFGDCVIVPGLINAHTHLEFSELKTPLGDPDLPFADWIRSVIQWRRSQDESTATLRTRQAVAAGLRESLSSGVTTVGEISTYDMPFLFEELYQSESGALPRVVSYRELLGLSSDRIADLLRAAECHLDSTRRAKPAISPHAPYTVHPDLLTQICSSSKLKQFPVAMHLAETREELELLRTQSGPLYEMLEAVGAWQENVFSRDMRPLHYLQQLQQAWRGLVVHGNYLDDDELDFLAAHRNSLSLAYCPRTHAYFGHDPYPLADALARGVRVVLGTDSRASNPDLRLLGEMQLVAESHPSVTREQLLEMVTIHAAEALGVETDRGSLEVGKRADLTVLSLNSDSTHPLDCLAWDASLVEVFLAEEFGG